MKRFYNYFLSLFLLTLAGITSAVAQDYKVGDAYETVDALVGKDVVLKGLGTRNSNSTDFLCGTKYSSTLTADCIYNIVAVDGETVDGNQVYVLKQKSTGLYYKDYALTTGEDITDEGYSLEMTSNINEAYKSTCLPWSKDEAEERAYSAPDVKAQGAGDNDPCTIYSYDTKPGFVFARVGRVKGDDIEFFGSYYTPFFSIYNDTNPWSVMAVTTLTGKEKFDAYYDFYYSEGAPSDRFTAGTTAGTYPANLVTAAQEAYNEATAAIDQSLSDEDYEALCTKIKSTIEAVQAAAIPLTNGLYLIHDMRDTKQYLYGETSGTVNRASCKNISYDGTLTTDLVPYVWRVTVSKNADGKDVATLYNVSKEGYMQKTAKDEHYILGDAAVNFITLHDGKVSKSAYRFQPEGTQEIVCTNPDGRVLNWTSDTDLGNHFVFESVDESAFNTLIAQVKQEALNSKLADVFSTAFNAYNKGIVYGSSSVAGTDEDFTHDGYLVEPGVDEEHTNWYSNAKEDSEGTYMALNDANLNTYFHSQWSAGEFTPTFTKNHYLVATLNEAVSGALEVKLAKRYTGNDYPTIFEVYGANEFDAANADAAQWTDLGTAAINWAYPATYPAWTANDAKAAGFAENQAHDEKTIEDGIGTAYVKFDGSYKYIKLAAVGTIYNKGGNTKRGYFCLSQANIWQANADAVATETAEMAAVPAAVKNALAEQINVAKAKLAGNATQEDINALQAAYDNFVNNYPDATRVSKALASAKSFLKSAQDNSLIGTELGLYDEEAATELKTTLDGYNDFSSTDVNAINEAVNAINAALAKFKASIILPEAGKIYMLHSASTKVGTSGEGFDGTLYNSIVYSPNNDASTSVNNGSQQGTVKFFRADGSADITEAKTPEEYEGLLTDTIDVTTDLRTAWYAEKSGEGKVVLRNVGTGMYLAPQNGQVLQSTTPVEIPVEGVGAKTFRLVAGVSHDGSKNDGKQTYLNTNGAQTTVVAWNDAADPSSYWKLDEVSDFNANQNVYVDGKKFTDEGENYYIATMPVAIDPISTAGTIEHAYKVLGVSSDNSKLVLAEYQDVIPAGTPFIYTPLSVDHGDKVAMTVADADQLEDGKLPAYNFEVTQGNGFIGTMTSSISGSSNFAFFNADGKIAQASTSTTIGCNSGVLNGACDVTAETGDATIALGNVSVTGINTAKAVVLPAIVNVYSIDGTLIRKNVKSANATNNLPAGIYVVGGQKVLVK